MSSSDKRLACVVIVLFIFIMGAWWWGLSEYRFLVSEYRSLTKDVIELQGSMSVMRRHVESSEHILSVLQDIQSDIKGRK